MKKSELKQLIKECMVEINEKPVTSPAPIVQAPIKLDIKQVKNIHVGGVDQHDYPDFSDAFIESAEYPDGQGGFRDLTEEELDWLNNEYPELANEKAHETMQGAGDNYRDYYEDR